MADRKDFHAPLPMRALGDKRLSALDLRTLGQIAFHDRLSLSRGEGRGCTASNQSLRERLGCDYSSLLKSISRLSAWGYIERKSRPGKKRLDVIRVIPDSWIENGRNGHASESVETVEIAIFEKTKHGEMTSFDNRKDGELAMFKSTKAGETNSKTHGKLPKTHLQDRVLNTARDIPEGNITYCAEATHFAAGDGYQQPDIFPTLFDGQEQHVGNPSVSVGDPKPSAVVVPITRALRPADPPQGLGRKPLDENELAISAQIARFERSFERRSRDLDHEGLLEDMDDVSAIESLDPRVRDRAQRLATAVREHQTQQARIVPLPAPPTETEILDNIRQEVRRLSLDDEDMSLLAARAKVPAEAVAHFMAGATPTRKHRLAIQIEIGKLAGSNPAAG